MAADDLRPPDRDPQRGIDRSIPEGTARRRALIAIFAVIGLGTLAWLLDLFLTLL